MARTLGDLLKTGMKIRVGEQDEIFVVIKVDTSNNQAWVTSGRSKATKDTWNNISKVCGNFVCSLDTGVAKALIDIGYGKAFILSKDEVVETGQNHMMVTGVVPMGNAWTRTGSSSEEAYYVGTTDRTFKIGAKTEEHLIMPVIVLPASLEVVYHEKYYYLACRTGVSGNDPTPINNPPEKVSYEYDIYKPVEKTLSFDGSENCTLTGTTKATAPGNYTACAVPKSGWIWKDGSKTSKTINWEIVVLADKPTVGNPSVSISNAKTSFDYDGEAHFPDYHYNENKVYIADSKSSGTKYPNSQDDTWGKVVDKLKRVDAGNYKNIFTLRSDTYTNIRWTGSDNKIFDGSADDLTYDWEIKAPAVTYIDIPTAVGDSFAYNGSLQKPELTYDETNVTVVLPSDYTNVGRYMGIFKLKDKSKTQWIGGGTDDISFIWEITGIPITSGEISQKGTLTYNWKEQTPKWKNYDPDKMTISGCTSATNAGNYIATFTPKPGYTWSNGTTYSIEITWTIHRKPIPPPTPNWTSREYNGKIQIPDFDFHGEGDAYVSAKTYSPSGEFLCDIDIPKGHS